MSKKLDAVELIQKLTEDIHSAKTLGSSTLFADRDSIVMQLRKIQAVLEIDDRRLEPVRRPATSTHRVGVYPGSFDPPTFGHLDLIQRAAELVDTLVVGIGVNSAKTPFLSDTDRLKALQECTRDVPNVEIETFEGLLVHYAQRRGANVIFRGLRAVSDYDYEFRIAMANRSLAPEIETALIIAKDEFSFLASSVVREVATLGGDYRQFVPGPVADLIARKLKA